MATCQGCGCRFTLFVALGEVPGGCTVNGVPYCWGCFEEAAREIESGAQPKTTVHR